MYNRSSCVLYSMFMQLILVPMYCVVYCLLLLPVFATIETSNKYVGWLICTTHL